MVSDWSSTKNNVLMSSMVAIIPVVQFGDNNNIHLQLSMYLEHKNDIDYKSHKLY